MAQILINDMARKVIDGSITLAMVLNRYGYDIAERVHNATISRPWDTRQNKWVRRVR